MVPIGNGILCLTIFINIIGITLIIVFAFNEVNIRNLEEIPKKSFHKFNLRGSELKINDIYSSFKNKDNSDINKLNENISKEKLRALESSKNDELLILMIISVIAIFFIINLILSVNYEDLGCGDVGGSNCDGDCSSGGCGGNDIGPAILLLIVIFLVIALFYMIQKIMGKKNAAYCSLISLSIIYMVLSVFCFVFIDNLVIGGISCGLFAFNLLLILIPNINWDYIFRCNGSEEETKLKGENENNNILIKKQLIATPMSNETDNFKNNDIGTPIVNKKGICTFKKNKEEFVQNQNDYKEMLNLPINDQVSQTPNSRISDLSHAPLPYDNDLPTENEIYNQKNYSNL